jgi:tRNA (guanine37-N1)-methyltransferase
VTLEIDVLTLFPAMLAGPLEDSIPRRIQERGLATIRVRDLRSWGLGRHRSVDDYTYGGGAGMVLRPEPVAAALAELRRDDSVAVLLDPAGEPFRQATAQRLSGAAHLILLCPRYEGVDERIRALVDLELSIGDYVLTGGELAALVVMDAVMRLLPGAIEADSVAEESFAAGLLEYPQYTRPPTFLDMAVPAVLTSGDHGAVRRWRLRESLRRTLERRPDLLEGRAFTSEERRLLDEIAVEPNEPPEAGPGPSMNGEARADAEAPAGSEAATRAESSTGDEAPKDAGAPLRFSTPHGRASVGDDAAGR